MTEATSGQTLSDDLQLPYDGMSMHSLDRKPAHVYLQLHQTQSAELPCGSLMAHRLKSSSSRSMAVRDAARSDSNSRTQTASSKREAW